MQPNPALASFDQMLIVLVLFRDLRQVLAQFDQMLIFLHPIVKEFKFLFDLRLCLLNGHAFTAAFGRLFHAVHKFKDLLFGVVRSK